METTTTPTTVQRAKCCECRSLFRVDDLDLTGHPSRRGDDISAFGGCPKCGSGWSETVTRSGRVEQTYILVGVKVAKVTTTRCSDRCMNSKSLECKCSCGGENHGR